MLMESQLTENTLDRYYDESIREHARLLSSLKCSTLDLKAERAVQKEAALVHGLATQVLKLKHFKREAAEKKARE